MTQAFDQLPQNTPAALATRSFSPADQHAFASLSGDSNPMHMDALAARRTQAGEPVVHGIHALLWTLDCMAEAGLPLGSAQSIKVQFAKFMYVGRKLVIRLTRSDSAMVRATVWADGLSAMTVSLRFGSRSEVRSHLQQELVAPSALPQVVAFETMAGRAGWLRPPVEPEVLTKLFPNAAHALDPGRLSGFAQLSRLVGMVCPGLHSIFAALSIDLTTEVGLRDGVNFSVRKVDERFRLVEMEVAGQGFSGLVTSFVRHPPIEAPHMSDVARAVGPNEFSSMRALIAGGSRGLGNITAKLVAAGGGQVTATYSRGREDAEKLQAEINEACGRQACLIRSYDALQPAGVQFDELEVKPTHLFYFPTPPIFLQKQRPFEERYFLDFVHFYVTAFSDMCDTIFENELSVFYPSSIAVEERPKGMLEYAMAKQAGEMLCSAMMAEKAGLRIHVERLPRILTDQTATVAQVESADALEVMLPIIRKMLAPG